jgi:hypothetical protein
MSEQTKIPESPHDMPTELWNSERWLRNTMCSLDHFRCVDIHWEKDIAATNATGESCGEWEVSITSAGGKDIRSKGEELLNVLWYAVEHANHNQDQYWQKREAARSAALSKLNDDDRKALGLAR